MELWCSIGTFMVLCSVVVVKAHAAQVLTRNTGVRASAVEFAFDVVAEYMLVFGASYRFGAEYLPVARGELFLEEAGIAEVEGDGGGTTVGLTS